MIETIAIIVCMLISCGLGFVMGCYLTLHSIRQDGIELRFSGNKWVTDETQEIQ